MPTKKASLIAVPVADPVDPGTTSAILPVFKKTTPVSIKEKPFIILPDKGGDIFKTRIQINSDHIKHILMCNDCWILSSV